MAKAAAIEAIEAIEAIDRIVHHQGILNFDLPSYRNNAAPNSRTEATRRQRYLARTRGCRSAIGKLPGLVPVSALKYQDRPLVRARTRFCTLFLSRIKTPVLKTAELPDSMTPLLATGNGSSVRLRIPVEERS